MSEEDEQRLRDYNDAEEYYSDWLSDHERDLQLDFLEENEDAFSEYCKKQFNARDER